VARFAQHADADDARTTRRQHDRLAPQHCGDAVAGPRNSAARNYFRAILCAILRRNSLTRPPVPSQVLDLAERVTFTRQCEEAVNRGRPALEKFKGELLERLGQYTSLETDEPLVTLKVKALVLDLIHHMDVVDQLIAAGTSSAGEWQWRKQLRFGAGADGKVTIHMVSASFDYTYEYQGNAPKLVHTPLTDKCYLTLTQAMFMGYGGNPYGPAGTGKTESVKALGGAFGRQVLVFNCDEGIDSKSMGRIFMGLVKCGAWGCFDEFNRLLPDQLSEISQQIQVIQAAIKARQPRMELEGTTTEVDANAGIFVTMNPAGKGYGGRSKLPDNLKALFRAVAMSAPNNEMIAEVMLSHARLRRRHGTPHTSQI
jgi:dynein heavy chain 2